MTLLDYARTIEPCQRNWDEDYEVPEEHIDYILDVCTTVPTKQNLNTYSLVTITDRETIENIYQKCAFDPQGYAATYLKNSQVNANVLFIWCNGTDKAEFKDDVDIAVGISSGAAALAAAELGYKTGFCKCFEPRPLRKILRKAGIKDYNHGILMLGVGKPNEDFPRHYVVRNGKYAGLQNPKGDKNILRQRVK